MCTWCLAQIATLRFLATLAIEIDKRPTCKLDKVDWGHASAQNRQHDKKWSMEWNWTVVVTGWGGVVILCPHTALALAPH